jgi:glycine hydroxymethyltransferase
MSHLESYLKNVPKESQKTSAIAYLAALDHISSEHKEVGETIIAELLDQRQRLKLIASENYSSLAVQLAMGNLLTDKYAEGYPHHRFYAGCENVDKIEDLAKSELEKLFQAEHAYVQPHSGADANLVAIFAALITRVQQKEIEALQKKQLEDLTPNEYEVIRKHLMNQRLLGMSLNSGGHLTHGFKHNISSKLMQAFSYDINPKTGLLDYDLILKQAREVKPFILMCGYSAYPRLINFAKMKEIADDVGAVLMCDMAHFAGLVAGKALKEEFNPIPYADITTSTTHKTMRGPRGGMVLCKKEFAEAVNKGCPLVMGGPLPHVIAAKACAFKEASTPEFELYAKTVISNSQALAEALKKEGFELVTGGSDNHLNLLNLSKLGLTGRQAEIALNQSGITANRNAIPFDPNGAWYTSGIRIGTPAMTTLGMKALEMKEIASILALVLKNTKPIPCHDGLSKAKFDLDERVIKEAKRRVKDLLQNFPLYPEIILKEEIQPSFDLKFTH